MRRPIIVFVVSLLLASCGGGDDGGAGGGGNSGGGGGGGGSASCTYGGSNYPVGQCIKINGSWMRCTNGGWQNVQMGGSGARPPGC